MSALPALRRLPAPPDRGGGPDDTPRRARGPALPPVLARSARLILAWVILAALLAIYIQESPRFGPREQRSVANQGMPLAIVGFGQTAVVLTGGIDLSVGSMVSLSNGVASRLADPDRPRSSMWLASIAALLVGTIGGAVNGLLVAYARLQPIIVTLATSYVFLGLALYVRPEPGGSVPLGFTDFWTGLMIDRQYPRSIVLLVALVLLWVVFRRTRLATRIYAVGSSEGAAFMSGVDVARTKVIAYTMAGLAASAAGLFLTAQTATGDVRAGDPYTLNSVAAVVLGGASLAGGAGTYVGTVAGAYVISLIPRVLFFYDVSPFYQQFYQGLILLGSVALGALGVLRMRNRLDRL
ncbi:MAG: hypothetical protein AVDCRST_MAG49-648 [uncultured Thermomicrobiales bacterium]|uniref:Ribose ABC transport system, permease protein RbsC n=1 Tax=uncultured Thermomicrobiales bacterium TaxID=1645740 RepID=A0A6J4U2M4_9BACT|nr:MAG: hypothetical protein AVDCRST_MAG49-648 [uncultured Thermomicrobiales bacterium]